MTTLFPALTPIGTTAGMFARDPFARVETNGRRAYRCCDCLDVFFTVESAKGASCGACGGAVEFMGRVVGARLTEIRQECPCDERCTGAVGPQCNCSCGGANHGDGRLVEVVRDIGPAPKLRGQRNPETLAARAAEYRALVAAARSAGRHGVADKAEQSRSHSHRMKILSSFPLRCHTA